MEVSGGKCKDRPCSYMNKYMDGEKLKKRRTGKRLIRKTGGLEKKF
jgi:hypothetical protein